MVPADNRNVPEKPEFATVGNGSQFEVMPLRGELALSVMMNYTFLHQPASAAVLDTGDALGAGLATRRPAHFDVRTRVSAIPW